MLNLFRAKTASFYCRDKCLETPLRWFGPVWSRHTRIVGYRTVTTVMRTVKICTVTRLILHVFFTCIESVPTHLHILDGSLP